MNKSPTFINAPSQYGSLLELPGAKLKAVGKQQISQGINALASARKGANFFKLATPPGYLNDSFPNFAEYRKAGYE
jgi:hypothetical protein